MSFATDEGERTKSGQLLPAPKRADFRDEWLTLPSEPKIILGQNATPREQEIAGLLVDELAELVGLNATTTRASQPDGGSISLVVTPHSYSATEGPEAYSLEIDDAIIISASTARGLLWGVQTLLQLLEESSAGIVVQKGKLVDWPTRSWRGLMLDPVRSWLDLTFIRRTIRVMSAYKLNILQLHLIDDQAWRIESHAWPRCNWGGEPFYSQSQLRELVSYAARYGVEIVPELDVPGHAMTAVNAYPELDCERKVRGEKEAILCSGRPFTWEFIERLVAEAAGIFPSAYIHLGADEPFAIKRWASCPDCRAEAERAGITTVEGAYHGFVIRLNELVRRHGKTLIVWNDAVHPGVNPMPPKNIILDAWINWESVKPLADAGYPLLNSSSGPLYLSSFFWREGLPLDAVLEWNATRFAHPNAKQGGSTLTYEVLSPTTNILGGHASVWATEQRLAERRLYPRLLAVAEILWAEEHLPSRDSFEQRFRHRHLGRLRRMHVPDDDTLMALRLFAPDENAILEPARAREGRLESPGDYRDFILTFEARGDADPERRGVFIRCHGGSSNGRTPAGFPIVAAAPPGQVITAGLRRAGWEKFEIVARDSLVSLTINGGLVWTVRDPSPCAGKIVLTSTPGGVQFRDVEVRDLSAAL